MGDGTTRLSVSHAPPFQERQRRFREPPGASDEQTRILTSVVKINTVLSQTPTASRAAVTLPMDQSSSVTAAAWTLYVSSS